MCYVFSYIVMKLNGMYLQFLQFVLKLQKKSLIFRFISHKVATTTLPLHASYTLATFGNRCFVATTTPFFNNASVFTQIYKQYFDFSWYYEKGTSIIM